MTAPEYHGLLVLDKPLGLTSREATDRAKRWFPRGIKVGHTGTLDPLATGVLVLCFGHATRLAEYVQDMGKTYMTDVTLGARSATDDAEGPITVMEVAEPPGRTGIDQTLRCFVGQIEQVPPDFSAAKVAGRRAYDLARAGHAARIEARTVRVDSIDVLHYDYPTLRLEITCGKGTYIRSLARDLGERLGCGAYVAALRRTRLGPFTPDQAVPLDTDPHAARRRLLPASAAVAGLARVTVAPTAEARFRNGQPVPLAREEVPFGSQTPTPLAVFGTAGDLVGIGRVDEAESLIWPSKVFPPSDAHGFRRR